MQQIRLHEYTYHYFYIFDAVPSGAPHNLSSFNITRSSFALSWSQPSLEAQNGRIIGYRVNVTDKKSFKKYLQTDTQNESLLVTAVEEGTTYFVSVAAMTKVGVGPYGEPISITTSKGAGTLQLHSTFSMNILTKNLLLQSLL